MSDTRRDSTAETALDTLKRSSLQLTLMIGRSTNGKYLKLTTRGVRPIKFSEYTKLRRRFIEVELKPNSPYTHLYKNPLLKDESTEELRPSES